LIDTDQIRVNLSDPQHPWSISLRRGYVNDGPIDELDKLTETLD
jgi:hypothetical protein